MSITKMDHVNIEENLSPQVSPFEIDENQSQADHLFRVELKDDVD